MRDESEGILGIKESLLHGDQKTVCSGYQLHYQPQPNVEGQCLLTHIVPIKKSVIRFGLFVLVCILFVCVPLLIVFWYPKLKKKIYYVEVPIEEATHFYVLNNDGQPSYPLKEVGQHSFTQNETKQVTYFYNRYLRYIVQEKTVKAAHLDFIQRLTQIQKQGTTGLTSVQVQNLRSSYGVGTMILQHKSPFGLFVDEIMRPLYIFIILSCLLWVYENYFYYSIIIFVTAAFGISTSLVQTYRINKKIFEMAYFETQVNVLRDGKIVEDSSKNVVPGDTVFVKKSIKIPFDGLLLHGSILSNQCSITGQSVPILKKSQPISHPSQIKNSYIYEGSTLIQINSKQRFKQNLQIFEKFREEYGLPIYVLHTNFITMKGQLIRIISFPIQRQNVFEKQSVKFLLFLFGLSVCSYIALAIKLSQYAHPVDIVVKFLDLITVTVPPGLPVSMTFGIIFALEKMKAKSIFCTSPNKTVVGGMTNYLCFDKTGTLTQDFMDFYALLPAISTKQGQKNIQPIFMQPIKKQSSQNIQQILQKNKSINHALCNMATNHTIVKLHETGENVGDPMQVKMFEFGQFTLNDGQIENPQIIEEYQSKRGHNGEVYRRYQFDSELFRMSTIAKSTITGQDMYLYTKGSPQHMYSIFDGESVPKNYHRILKRYTCLGFRVLAIGHRKIDEMQLSKNRKQIQNHLVFDGFQVFQNRLKPQTKDALAQLRDANLPFVMITGDNPLTASSIAYECGIFDQSRKAYICHWQVDHYLLEKFHEHQLDQFEEDQHRKYDSIEQILSFVQKYNFQLCVTGRAFNHIFDNHYDNNKQQCKKLLTYIKVYARAKPNDKVRVITVYQSLGKTVGMCGDGANDCGALKQADIGLSLSQAQASISAPFTSQITNISSMIELLKQCRAGLATNFSLFNIMAFYSLIQYNSVVIIEFFFGFPGDFHYLYWDVCCNFVFFLTFGYTATSKKLTKQAPNSSLFSISNISQLLIIFTVQLLGQLSMIMLLNIYSQELDYTPQTTYNQFIEDGDQFVTQSFQNNILFMFTNFMYIFTLLGFSISKPWRQQFYYNKPFTILLVIVLIMSSVLVVIPDIRPQFMQLSLIEESSLLWIVLGVGWGCGVFVYVLQKYVLEPYFNKLKLRQIGKEVI